MSELVQSFGDSTEPMVVLDGVSKVFGNGPKAVVAVDNVSSPLTAVKSLQLSATLAPVSPPWSASLTAWKPPPAAP